MPPLPPASKQMQSAHPRYQNAISSLNSRNFSLMRFQNSLPISLIAGKEARDRFDNHGVVSQQVQLLLRHRDAGDRSLNPADYAKGCRPRQRTIANVGIGFGNSFATEPHSATHV
jgi:hypothetical protein